MSTSSSFNPTYFTTFTGTSKKNYTICDWSLTKSNVFTIFDTPVRLLNSSSNLITDIQEITNHSEPIYDDLTLIENESIENNNINNHIQELLHARYQDGYTAGFIAGELQAVNRIETETLGSNQNKLNQLLEVIVEKINALSEKKATQQFDAFKRMALGLATEIAKVEISINPSVINTLVRTCLAALDADTQEVTIAIHPDDLVLIRTNGVAHELNHIIWVEDDTLQLGSIRANTDHTAVEDLLQHRLSALTHELFKNEGDTHDRH